MNKNIENILVELEKFRRNDEITYSAYSALYDEIALLDDLIKDQEPRVMTVNEIEPDELVWIEVPQSNEIWPTLLRRLDWFDHPTWAMRGYGLAAYYLHEGYGRDWRCWTAKPMDEQRKAVEWGV